MGMRTIIMHVPKRCSQWFRISTEVKKAPAAEAPLTETVKVIASKCGSNHRQAAKELMNEMKRQMLNRRGDLLTSQVWKNNVGFVTDDKGGKAAMEALHISLPVMTMELMKYQPMPKLEWDPENRGIYTQSDSPKKSSRNIWSLAVVSVDQRY